MKLLDSIQSKVLQIIGVNDQQAKSDLNIPSLHHRCLVAAASILYKMQTKVNVQPFFEGFSPSTLRVPTWGEFYPWGRNECVKNEPQRTRRLVCQRAECILEMN